MEPVGRDLTSDLSGAPEESSSKGAFSKSLFPKPRNPKPRSGMNFQSQVLMQEVGLHSQSRGVSKALWGFCRDVSGLHVQDLGA